MAWWWCHLVCSCFGEVVLLQFFDEADTRTIHDTPKRSATMPKSGEKKVLVKGICTCPPSPSAANNRRASASSRTVSESEKPWNLSPPSQRPSEANTVVSPIRKLACITLSSEPGWHMPGSGLSLKWKSV